MNERMEILRQQGRALVTGASRGIGYAVAERLSDAGFSVIAVGRRFEPDAFAGRPDVEKVVFDLTRCDALAGLVEGLGPISVLINNAGVMNPNTWKDYPEEARARSLHVNLVAPVELMRLCAPGMLAAGGGAIVNVASIAGYIGHSDHWYGATKAGLLNVTKTFALQLGAGGVTVNAVAPGPVETDMLAMIPPERRAMLRNNAVTGRFATPAEVADAVLTMAFGPLQITGATLDVCAGAVLR
ncbi:MAG: short-chain dehydrogenase [Deltaproteobacteria bacterium HGW-Deltaproteobacteria-22]|jgi:3-oxoacyl-[acyl-carrier protein] reductase|nr:MAG: short-chain dehydrogenase [Deltaproteobacteria bacterium HGW-Deltaproteobacteria-22]